MIIYTIYKIVNQLNGKVYIGFDSKWPKRKTEHKSSSKKLKNKFYNAINKYGLIKGIYLGVWRILRCNAWSKGGYDPVK